MSRGTAAGESVSPGGPRGGPERRTPDSAAAVRDPFVLDIRSLGRRPGTMSEVHRTAVAHERLGVDMIAIPEDSEVDLDLRLESVSEGVLVTGTVSGETQGQCSRCLEPVDGTVTVFLTELFAYPDSETEQTTDAEDIHRIKDDRVDLEQSIIDAVALELPMSPLCSDDCEGLCPECGVRLAVAEPGHAHDVIDPRWAALRDKFGSTEEASPHTSGRPDNQGGD
ncbi:YceD family protein [Gordonia sp. DT218]|uniref:YceD family protein n=1 Tax=Gordonia sp. DT218 TaxID=3416659 RepID=UPI003CEF04C0